jgi:hypothetical protein
MKNLIIAITLIFLLFNYSFAQAPDTLWTKTYGDSSHDGSSSIIKTSDESFIVTGRIGTELLAEAYTTDIWLFEIDAAGSKVWSFNYGGMSAGNIVDASIDEFFVAAETFNQGSWEDMEILKIYQDGDTIWTKTFYYSQHEYKPEIKKTSDGGLIILGFTYGYPKGTLLIKTDEFGDTLWTKFYYHNIYSLRPSSLEIDDDDGYLFLVRKSDSTFVYKTDSLGNLIRMNKVCFAPFSASKLLKTEDGNYLMLGTFHPNSDSSFIWISMLNDNFETIWSQTYLITMYTAPSTFIKSNTGGYLIIGYESEDRFSQTDGLIMKINDSGEIIWKETYGGVSDDYFNDILILENKEFMVVGSTSSFGAGGEDAWVLKFSADTATTGVKALYNSELPEKFNLYQNYPNPFNPSTTIKFSLPSSSYATLKIYNALGEEIAVLVNKELTTGTYEIEWDASDLPSGIYFYQLKTDGYVETKKMILMK